MRKPSANDIAVYEAVKSYNGSYSAAVKHVAMERGYKVPSVYGIMDRVKKWNNRTEAPAAPMDVVAAGQALKGVSSLVDADGNIVRQWIKTDREQESWRQLIDAALEKARNLTPVAAVAGPNPYETFESMTFYPVADLHIGIAAAIERGWDLETAVETYAAAFSNLIARSMPTSKAVISFLGDLTHMDNDSNVTPRSGKKLDVSADYTRVVGAAMNLICQIIDRIASKHVGVDVYYLAGNHDTATATVMQAALNQLYRADTRIKVHSSGLFAYHAYGRNLLGMYHGHTAKLDDLPSIMAADQPIMWGESTNRVWHVGHYHHRTVKEYRGCTVEVHRSPAPRDTWHFEQGYRSDRGIVSISYDFAGEIARSVVNL